jgi:HTH-type transcriptional regulator, transcriptional repressor of NAD biosynthesis genes
MKRGLVIGKFLPVHQGHIALINFAAKHCDELIVSLSAADADAIDPSHRLEWLKEIFRDNPSIRCYQIKDDFDDDSLPWNERTKIWSDIIRKTYPKIDVVISSETYGDPFAQNLGAKHIAFDPPRNQFPVSASKIRRDPFRYWNFIPTVVRPYFVKKVCIYGPESTGKSSLAVNLATQYKTEFVPEVARELLIKNDFSIDEIIHIGRAHAERISEKVKTANKVLFCDTDVITTQIYSDYYLQIVPEILFEIERETVYDHYFLLTPEVAWVEDGLRDLGHKRQEMFHVFRNALERRGIGYTLVEGTDYLSRQHVIENWLAEHYHLKV